jgi:hypothetical protein
MAQNSAAAIVTNTGYTLNLNNTLLVLQVGAECFGAGGATNGGPGTLDDDGTCHVQYSNQTGADTGLTSATGTQGGPTTSVVQPAGNPYTSGKGVAPCPIVDQRFFVNPSGTCDVGSTTTAATQETTPPSCTVTGGSAGPPKTQQVTLVDSGSGVGPSPGPATDNPSNTTATAYPPPAAVPVFGYPVDNLQINNGSVSFTPPSSPTTTGQVLTATKTTAGTPTQWSFTGLNWAGIAKNCF